MERKICPECGKEFISTNKRQEFCCKACGCNYRRHEFRKANPLPTYHKTCLFCGKSFETKSPLQVFCSRDCKRGATNKAKVDKRRAEMSERKCPFCGKEIPYGAHLGRKFCSPSCQRRYRDCGGKPAEWRVCEVCGERFIPNTANQRSCSACSAKDRSGGRRRTSEERNCEICGKPFVPRSPSQKYCSKECAGTVSVRKQYEPRQCNTCGKLFVPKVYNQRYCSADCSGRVKKDDYSTNLRKAERQRLWESRQRLIKMEKAAKEAGMSYGKYRAFLEMKGEAEWT